MITKTIVYISGRVKYMPATGIANGNDTRKRVTEMINVLADDQVQAVNSVMNVFIADSPFRPKTEDELFERIDRSLAQADAGELQDADEAIDEVVADLGL